mmetsp:Transcript_16273/g.42050  ORF Transcript_16273/g.42050 Transcript_16273/m.42050 type:complete len:361 (+) Transcript_16273:81-1163(+)
MAEAPHPAYGVFGEQPPPYPGEGFGFPPDGATAPAPPSARQSLIGRQNLVLIPLCRKGDRANIEKQLQHGANVGEVDLEGNTPLHVAVEAPKNEIATVQCLLEHSADPNATNYIGAAPLHYVCLRKSNHRGIANILLENGAMVDGQTLAGKTALHFACEQQMPELVEVFCMFAANTNLTDTEGNTPMHLALIKEGGRDTVKRQIVEYLLSSRANCTHPNAQGWMPVHYASRHGYTRCLQLLIEREADVSSPTARGETCLHLACQGGFTEVTQMLVQTTPQNLNACDTNGNTPLHLCASHGTLECALILLRVGVNTELKNAQRQSAFDLAKIKGTDLNSNHNPELAQVLKEAQTKGGCRQS